MLFYARWLVHETCANFSTTQMLNEIASLITRVLPLLKPFTRI